MKPKILIVGTVPYNEKFTSRSFDSYFHFWEKESIAQIFSNPEEPVKGHCNDLYQITDYMMLKRWLNHKYKVGKIYKYDNLKNIAQTNSVESLSPLISRLFKIGKNKNSIIYLGRKMLWRKKFWCSSQFNSWINSVKPECVFLSFSDDFFILDIALYIAEKFNIPIITSIGDDYYFNYKKTISPFYHIYKLSYRKLVKKVLNHKGSTIYISDKIRDKYNDYFSLNGKTIFLTSSIKRRTFKPINTYNPIISYFGNLRLGRNDSLIEIANALSKISKNYTLNIYSNETDSRIYRKLMNISNVNYCGTIPYSEVQSRTMSSDILIVVEGFEKKDIDITRYSLSTKIADSISSGVNVYAYGSLECGAIEYAKDSNCIVTCTNKEFLEKTLKKLIFDTQYQEELYKQSLYIAERNHNLKSSTSIFENMVYDVIEINCYINS